MVVKASSVSALCWGAPKDWSEVWGKPRDHDAEEELWSGTTKLANFQTVGYVDPRPAEGWGFGGTTGPSPLVGRVWTEAWSSPR